MDGLFGQCYSEAESELLKPLVLEKPLNAVQSEFLRLELSKLANNGLDWQDAKLQCILAYFKLSILYELDYDTEFCSVRNHNDIWFLIQVFYFKKNLYYFNAIQILARSKHLINRKKRIKKCFKIGIRSKRS